MSKPINVKSKDYLIHYYMINDNPCIKCIFLLERNSSFVDDKLSLLNSKTHLVDEKILAKIAKKLNVKYEKPRKQYVICVNTEFNEIESARWSFNEIGGDISGKDILKVGKKLLPKKIKLVRSKNLPPIRRGK